MVWKEAGVESERHGALVWMMMTEGPKKRLACRTESMATANWSMWGGVAVTPTRMRPPQHRVKYIATAPSGVTGKGRAPHSCVIKGHSNGHPRDSIQGPSKNHGTDQKQ